MALTGIKRGSQGSREWHELTIVTLYAIEGKGVKRIAIWVRILAQLHPIDCPFIVVGVKCPNRNLRVRRIESHTNNRIEERRRLVQVGQEMTCDNGGIKRIEEQAEKTILEHVRIGCIRAVKYIYC